MSCSCCLWSFGVHAITINTNQLSGCIYYVTSDKRAYAKGRKSAVSVLQAHSIGLQDQMFAPAGSHSATSVQSQSVNLTAGYHSIEVDYCNLYGVAELSLKWKGPTDSAYTVSASHTVLAAS